MLSKENVMLNLASNYFNSSAFPHDERSVSNFSVPHNGNRDDNKSL